VQLLNEARMSQTFQAGQVIFYQENPCHGLHCVQSGCVAVRKIDSSGNQLVTRLGLAGQTLGYRTFFSRGNYRANAEALTESRVCFIRREVLDPLLSHNPALKDLFLERLAADLEAGEEARLRAIAMPLQARFVHLLLLLKDHFGEVDRKGHLILTLPFSRRDIAAMLGARPERPPGPLRTDLASTKAQLARPLLTGLDLEQDTP
jgi:CRP/FNR family transcriptional regulator